jgi:MOSC domain-containing protein YiiM
MAHITSIVYQPRDRRYAEGDMDYVRESLPDVELVAGCGLRGDRKGSGNPNRQVNVLSREWLDEAAAKGYRAGPGQFGEQLIVEGLDVIALPIGTRLRLGGDAELEIASRRTGCERLEAAQGRSIEGLGPVGVMARVVKGGTICVGDPVTVLEPAIRNRVSSGD